MPRQSQPPPPTLLLTRPAPQNKRFAEQMAERFGGEFTIVSSPLLTPRFLSPAVEMDGVIGIVFTSETGVEGFRRLSAERGVPAWCVGSRTASVARDAGFETRDGGGDAHSLIERIVRSGLHGRLLVARGQDQAVDVGGRLNSAGIETKDAVVYAQDLQPLSDAARHLLSCDSVVAAPLFSARTAAHFANMPEVRMRRCALWLAGLSATVAQAWTLAAPEREVIAQRPGADALIDALEEWYGTERQP